MPQCWIEPWNSDDILSLATTVALTAPKSQQGLLNCSYISTLVSFTATSCVEASGDIQYFQALLTHAVLKMEQTVAFLIISPTKNFFSPRNQRRLEFFMQVLYFTSFA